MAEHGTTSRYTYGCRCVDCRTAKNRYDKQRHLNAQLLAAKVPRIIPHGTANGYAHYGCRCQQCVTAISEVRRTWPSRQRRAS